MIKQKTKSRLKRTLSGVLALAMTASVAAVMPAAAEETAKYPYAVFAADNDAGITINTQRQCIYKGCVWGNRSVSQYQRYCYRY